MPIKALIDVSPGALEAEHNLAKPGEILSGSSFNEPTRVITINPVGADSWEFGLVGLDTQLFRNVPLTQEQMVIRANRHRRGRQTM